MTQVLCYGAGVQTFGILCLIKLGELPKPDLAIFADTNGEKPETYQHIVEVAEPLMHELKIPFIKITRGNLLEEAWTQGHTPRPPLCSKTYKVRPINAYLRQQELTPATTWIGITTDEAHRANSPSDVSYIIKRYPLLELEFSRAQVAKAIDLTGLPRPVKSGCWFCPWNTGRAYWQQLREKEPNRFVLAVHWEQTTGHKLSNGSFWLDSLGDKADLPAIEPEADFQCTTGYCNS
ncbi:MAG TPA: hypothetical protein VH186_08370 [Chloroflexia bacterium]|nr:hypothetical protein [Chloroflexia bacterium]